MVHWIKKIHFNVHNGNVCMFQSMLRLFIVCQRNLFLTKSKQVEKMVVVWWSRHVPSLRTWHPSTGWRRGRRRPQPDTRSNPSEDCRGHAYPDSRGDAGHPVYAGTQKVEKVYHKILFFIINNKMVPHASHEYTDTDINTWVKLFKSYQVKGLILFFTMSQQLDVL